MTEIRFEIPGTPVGKARPRFIKQTGRAYNTKKTTDYESVVVALAYEAMIGAELMLGPVNMDIEAIFEKPKSWTKKRKAETFWHTFKPDGDNIAKIIGDGCNGIIYKDDSQVCVLRVMKRYGTEAKVIVKISPITI